MDNEQLLAEMKRGFDSVNARYDLITARFELLMGRIDSLEIHILDRIEAMEKRIQRQGGLVQGGSRVINRLMEWSEDTDTELLRHAQRIADLERQLSKLLGGAA